jgi:glyoxylase-like metal-dependent hydrolase (beta-lactamase superfamily II)/ferredoxin
MADVTKRLSTNVEGDFFVDATCINCDTCRQLAPATFREAGDFSSVARQPADDRERHRAYQALLACPVGSIGTAASEPSRMQEAKASFPLLLESGVYYNGFNSAKSFGGNSYFIRHPEGNWLVDSPRYLQHLVEAFERLGGIRYVFLTHEDDVADSARYAERFKAARIIHRADAEAAPGAERIIEGTEPVRMDGEFLVIPVPGHTEGSLALLYRNRFLFSGDHLWWEREKQGLGAPKRLVWDERHLLASLARLLDYRFEWLLPGHGERVSLPATEMSGHLARLVAARSASRPASSGVAKGG